MALDADGFPVTRTPAGVVRAAAGVRDLAVLDARVSGCRACPRLVAWREEVARTKRAAYPVMHPGRVDVIGAGALVLRVIMDAFDLEDVVVSEHDILDGIALRLARG